MKRFTNLLISPVVLCLGLSCIVAQSSDKSRSPSVNASAITGRVVGAGKGLTGASIILWRQSLAQPSDNSRVATALTDSAGNYELTNVPPGNYFIKATAPGFVTGKENQVFQDLRYVNVIANQNIEGINFELIRHGVIKGVVTDADGKPVARTRIAILPEALAPGTGPPPYAMDLHTDDQGIFRINGVPPGRYRVAAGDESVAGATYFGRKGYRQVFYPGAADETQATVIDIAEGTEISNVNINLGRAVKTFSVSAKIVDDQTGEPIEGVNYALQAYSNGKRIGGVGTREVSNSQGEITIQNIPAGEYSIRVPGGRGSYPQGEIPAPPNLFGDSKHFEVKDSNVGEIEVRVIKGATVSGFVVVEGPAGQDILSRVSQMKVVAAVLGKPGSTGSFMPTHIKPDGSFSFTGLRPGKLQISFQPPAVGGPLPLRSLRIERAGVKLDRDLEIQAGDRIAGLRVVLGYGNGRIQGVVKVANGSLPLGAQLIARAFQGRRDVPALGYIYVDNQGRFLIQNLPAGEYDLVIGLLNSGAVSVEQKVVVADNATTETIVQLDLTARDNPK